MERKIKGKGIETRTFFIPIEGLHPLYPCVPLTDFRILIYVSKANVGCKVDEAEELARTRMYLPSSSGLKEEEIKYICDAIKEITWE